MDSSFPTSIFRSYNIRGLLHEVTPDIARKAAQILVFITKAKRVVVGRDMRETSPELMAAAIEGVRSMGADAVNIGMCTSSLYNYAITSDETMDAGIMITASHNPAEYNGIKMAYSNGSPITGIEILKHFSEEFPKADIAGKDISLDILASYLDACITNAALPFISAKIVIDYGNGMGAMSLSPLCKRLGLDVVEMYAEPDAHFPNHEANPAKKETLRDLQRKVLEIGADFGVASDGDGDRIAYVDNTGVILAGDGLLALLAQESLARHPGGKVLYPVNVGWIVPDVIASCGGEDVLCPVGNTKIIRIMHDVGGVFGGEESGHYFFPEFHNLETIDFAFLKVLGLWHLFQGTFEEMVRPLRKYVNSGEINIHIQDSDKAIETLRQHYELTATKIITLDGIRMEFGHDWWFLIRKSNTEPLVRITVEAKDEELMQKQKDAIIALVESL